MKTKMKMIVTTAFTALLLATFANAEECKAPPAEHSKEFEQLKQLDGKWEGSVGMGGKAEKIEATYHVTAGGSAVVETLFPGTPHEMVSVYTDNGGKLSMTHYCMMGNQPKMDLTSGSPNELQFELSKDSPIKPSKEDHMHSVNIAFVDHDNIIENWIGFQGGRQGEPNPFKLKRVK